MFPWHVGFLAIFGWLFYATFFVLIFWLALRLVKAFENIAVSLKELVQIQKEKK